MINKFKLMIALGCMMCAPGFLKADQAPSAVMDCSKMPPDIAQFAVQLNTANQKMFCGQFNDAQRATAIQLASQQDAMGKSMMTPDQAVQKVATDNNMMAAPAQKTPTGCPVK